MHNYTLFINVHNNSIFVAFLVMHSGSILVDSGRNQQQASAGMELLSRNETGIIFGTGLRPTAWLGNPVRIPWNSGEFPISDPSSTQFLPIPVPVSNGKGVPATFTPFLFAS